MNECIPYDSRERPRGGMAAAADAVLQDVVLPSMEVAADPLILRIPTP